jgi:hypothetical protein
VLKPNLKIIAGSTRPGSAPSEPDRCRCLIQVVTSLGMIPAGTAVNIPLIARMVNGSNGFAPGRNLEGAAVTMLDELSRWVGHLEPVRLENHRVERPRR